MSNPRIQPRERIGFLSTVPFGYFPKDKESELLGRLRSDGRDIGFIQKSLAGLDMAPADSVLLSKEGVKERVAVKAVREKLSSGKEVFALTNPGDLQFRVRTADGGMVVKTVLEALPVKGFGAFTRRGCEAKIQDKYYVAGGSHFTLPRLAKYYPRSETAGLQPPTLEEAKKAFLECGLYAGGGERYEYEQLSVNPKSDNGLPVMGKWEDALAQQEVMTLAGQLELKLKELMRTLRGPETEAERLSDWVNGVSGLTDAYPAYFTFMGKAKQDYYTEEKLNQGHLRFYNVVPRQLQLLMMRATQPFEAESTTLEAGAFTSMGSALAAGGAQEWVETMCGQGVLEEFGLLHCGDDSWIIHFRGDKVTMFALDCSSFDLTQHARVTVNVHRVFYQGLAGFDEMAAGLWFALMRERRVVVAGNVAYTWYHAGPSGMLLQSKVNDVLMHIFIMRLLADIKRRQPEGDLRESTVSAAVEDQGKGMGFVVKLEQFGQVPFPLEQRVRFGLGYDAQVAYKTTDLEWRKKAVIAYLALKPFLYVGYYFHAQQAEFVGDATITVVCDLPRTLSQMAYPSVKWYGSEDETRLKEAMRLGAQFLSAGVPPLSLTNAFTKWRAAVMHLVLNQLTKWKDKPMPELKWAIDQGVLSPDTPQTLQGLYNVLQKGNAELWLGKGKRFGGVRTVGPSNQPPKLGAETIGFIKRVPGRKLAEDQSHAGAPTTSRNQGRPPPIMKLTEEEMALIREMRARRAAAAGDRRERVKMKGRYRAEEEDEGWGDSEYSSEYTESYPTVASSSSSSFDEDWGYDDYMH